jgi:hypothetical protein
MNYNNLHICRSYSMGLTKDSTQKLECHSQLSPFGKDQEKKINSLLARSPGVDLAKPSGERSDFESGRGEANAGARERSVESALL